MKKLIYFLITGLLIWTIKGYAQEPLPIPGWKMEKAAGAYVFTPPNQGKFVYTIMPVRKAGGDDMAAWTESILKSDLSQKGFVLDREVANRKIQNIFSCAATTHDNAGDKRIFTYFSYQLANNDVRVASFNSAPTGDNNYLKQAAVHLAAFSKKELAPGAMSNAATQTEKKPSTETGPPVTSSTKENGNIRGIILHKETKLSGTLVMPYEAAYLMLNDGSTLMYIDEDPYTLNIEQSKRTSKNWGKWRQSDSEIILTYNSSDGRTKTEQWAQGRWRWAVQASDNEKLAGSFTTISIGGGISGAFSGAAKNLTLNKSGQFSLSTSAATNYKDASGNNGVYNNRNTAGTYILKGFSIEFHFNNGKTDKHAFYFFDNDKDMFGIDKGVYTHDSK